MADHAQRRPATVGIVAVAQTAPAVLYGLYEVFAAVGTVWAELTGEPVYSRQMRPRVVAEGGEPFACALGMLVTPHARFADAPDCDVVIVPDLALTTVSSPIGCWPAAVAWLRGQYERGAVVCSVCTGSILLAETGLLEGVDATTHWSARALFQRFYPGVALKPERILLPAGPDHRIVTSGGHASWTDLALYLVARFSGREEAVRMAKVFVLGDHGDGQLPFAIMARPARHGDAAIARAQTWIGYHYAAPNPVACMVAQSGLAQRTFKRRFRAATGYAPIEYVQTLRVEEAKHLLETTGMATEDVAAAVGYQDLSSFRRVFRRIAGSTPARYRRRFTRLLLPATQDSETGVPRQAS